MNPLLHGACALLSGIAAVTLGHAQTPTVSIETRPVFDVATIKINRSGTGVDRIRGNNGSLTIENVSLQRLIFMAYDIPESQQYLLSGPDWLSSENFDIQAKFPPGTPDSKSRLMLQRLLEERFRMALRREPRSFSVLALVKGKKEGPQLHPAAAPEAPYKFRMLGGHATGSSLTMVMLAGRLSRPDVGLGRPVVDFTGLSGTFDLILDWKPENLPEGSPNPESKSDASIFAAMEEQLGLRLEPRKVSLDVLVIDHANKTPTEN
jgi:uncharacterized protein (TIGR03435 family)